MLFALSLIYGFLVRALSLIYGIRPHKLRCKVISVGNITLGGTGKTSLVELIAGYLSGQNHKVAILSRGYGRKMQNACLRQAGKTSMQNYEDIGDEPWMLKNNLKDIPVLVDSNRLRSANLAICGYAADTVILDDGLQQWRLKKDLEIVAIDAADPFGNGRLLPRGILRQPLSTLKKADVFVLTKADLAPDIKRIKNYLKGLNPPAEIFESVHKAAGFYKLGENQNLLDTGIFKGRTVAAFSGIGDPAYFENTLMRLGVNIGLSFRFPDHHAYSQNDMGRIIEGCGRKNIDTVITTQKDAARLNAQELSCQGAHIFVLRVKLAIIKDEEGLYCRLRKLYSL